MVRINTLMTNNKCCICDDSNFKTLFNFGNFPIVKCNKCGLVYSGTKPLANDVYQMYEGNNEWRVGGGIWRPLANKIRISWMQFFCSGGNLLEIGCADGGLLDAAKKTGRYQVRGIEISKPAVEYAKKQRKINVSYGTLINHNFKSEEFDGVIMWHVIEHLMYPLLELREVFRILKNKGTIFISTPNISHPKSIIAKEKWKYFGPPCHLWYFSPKTLSLLVKKSGFKIMLVWRLYLKAHVTLIAQKVD